MARLGLIAELKRAARAMAAVNCGTFSSLSLHNVSYADAATLWSSGFHVHAYTGDLSDTRVSAWHALTMTIEGVSVTAFTVHRPAMPWEIERERASNEAAPALAHDGSS